MKRTISVRAAALTAVAALGLSGLGLGAAFAADGDPVPVPDVSSIDQKTGSITVHKYTPTTTASSHGNGKELTASTDLPGAEPIEGIKFKAWKINVADIKQNAAWKKFTNDADDFNAAKGAEAKKKVLTDAGYTLEAAATPSITTGSDGSGEFANLPVGFYYLEEVTPQAEQDYKIHGNPEKTVKGKKISGVDPFIVAVPMTNPDDKTAWMYDIHVYPKNTVSDNEKSVEDESAHGSGNDNDKSNLVYTIKTDLPGGTNSYKSYKVVDPLNEKLTYVGDQDASKDVVTAINNQGADVDTFTVNTDYKITKSGTDQRTITLEFTEPGRAKLITARNDNGAVKVQWKLHARVKDTAGKTEIPNTAYPLPPNEADPTWDENNKPENPTNKVISKYGKVEITKVVKGDDASGLNGAKFALFVCDAQGTFTDGDRVSVDNVDEWTSKTVNGDKGKIVIDGLRLNNWMNASPAETGLIDPATEYYCLKELQAPQGYELLPNPIKFQLLTTDPEWTKSFNVENVPDNDGFKLPVTGGQGIALLVTAGGLLVAGSVIYTVAAARKRKQQA